MVGPGTVFVTANDLVSVYLNGLHVLSNSDKSSHASANVYLKKGDVLSFFVKKVSGTGPDAKPGLKFVVQVGKSVYASGQPGLVGVHDFWNPFDTYSWQRPDYVSCHWPPAVKVSDSSLTVANGFPTPNRAKAKYVWTEVNPKTAAFFRYVIGGESCLTAATNLVLTVHLKAIVYVNGKQLRRTLSNEMTHNVPLALKKGDVVAIRAWGRGRAAGLKAALIGSDRKSFDTGVHAWRATTARQRNVKKNKWMNKNFNA